MTASVVTTRLAGPLRRARYAVSGVVEGVGFRPFVYGLAHDLGLTGYVGNSSDGVFAEVQGADALIAEFERRLRCDAPPLAVITDIKATNVPTRADPGFVIVDSQSTAGIRTLAPPDAATCQACLVELFDISNRRHRHPFITCTNCGPRFTIIRDLPYDRPATTMSDFPMCPACSTEYNDPTDRRHHAQPISCHDCGPRLWFESGDTRTDGGDAALNAAQSAIAAGEIVAVKGIGGYHLACRADSPETIDRLRMRKARDQKPFAVMARDLAVARSVAQIDEHEATVLTSRPRPIVLLRRLPSSRVADVVAPGNPLLGVMLPYSPLHQLLLTAVPGGPSEAPDLLVMTSANISDEPLCFDDIDADSRLSLLADSVLRHDRPIHVPCDDSVVRVIDGEELPIRRSRGYAPLPVALPTSLPPTLAVGAELKNTCCFIDGNNAFCSAHVGDMGSIETQRAFERAVGQLVELHQVQPTVIAADKHPGYHTRSWAERHSDTDDLPTLHLVQHHHAHVAALLAEHGRLGTPLIGVAFDGTGYGEDGSVWGGEFLLVDRDPSVFQRVGYLLPVTLPGGDAAVRNPCRMALTYLDAAGIAWEDDLAPVRACTGAEQAALRSQLDHRTNTVACSSMGRLFDAVSSLLDLRHRVNYEAQAAIDLEILAEQSPIANHAETVLRFDIDSAGRLDHRPLIQDLVDLQRRGIPAGALARAFHIAVADAVSRRAAAVAAETGCRTVGLTGGVFQNVFLTRCCRAALQRHGLEVLTHRLVPPNDGGIALGQAVLAGLAAARSRRSDATGR